jgi:magnesium-protoporphyrin IX monomethyl ester (oxidative) cyclase
LSLAEIHHALVRPSDIGVLVLQTTSKEEAMKVLLVHPSPLMYSEIYLRLEPLGMERVAAAVRAAGHEVRLLDLQVFKPADYNATLAGFRPNAIGFSLNYLANVPEVIDLARQARALINDCFIFIGGHSASFIAEELIEHGEGAIDCVVRGEGEAITPQVIEAIGDPALASLPGVVTGAGAGPAPILMSGIDGFRPARDLSRRRNRYFISVFDPCASIEFTRGCPWDCSFCSAWTFYGRSYRQSTPEAAADELASIAEPNVFIVDDVAFIHPEHGMAIGREIEKRGIKKNYYLETRADVLIRNREVFEYWHRLGLDLIFIGIEAIDEEALKLHRKRSSPALNFKALEVANEIGLTVAVNLIADPDWDVRRFEIVREWASGIDDVVHLTVATPYPGTETWFTESRELSTLDYRLFDIQHAVLPTRLPLNKFYEELVKTQQVLAAKHLGFRGLWQVASTAAGLLMRGQTNFVRMLWKFNTVYNPQRQYADHFREVRYAMRPPHIHRNGNRPPASQLYIHNPRSGAAANPPG